MQPSAEQACDVPLALYFPHPPLSQLDRLLGSQAFSLPVSRMDAIANGYISGGLGEQDYGAQTGTDLTVAGRPGAIEYTRSGEILGAASASRIRGVSGQVGIFVVYRG